MRPRRSTFLLMPAGPRSTPMSAEPARSRLPARTPSSPDNWSGDLVRFQFADADKPGRSISSVVSPSAKAAGISPSRNERTTSIGTKMGTVTDESGRAGSGTPDAPTSGIGKSSLAVALDRYHGVTATLASNAPAMRTDRRVMPFHHVSDNCSLEDTGLTPARSTTGGPPLRACVGRSRTVGGERQRGRGTGRREEPGRRRRACYSTRRTLRIGTGSFRIWPWTTSRAAGASVGRRWIASSTSMPRTTRPKVA